MWFPQDVSEHDPLQVATSLLHMLGHSLGLQHEGGLLASSVEGEAGGHCDCPDWYGCLMADTPL